MFVVVSYDYMHLYHLYSLRNICPFLISSFAASSNPISCLLIIHLSRHGISTFIFSLFNILRVSSFFGLLTLTLCCSDFKLRTFIGMFEYIFQHVTRRLIYRKWLDQFYVYFKARMGCSWLENDLLPVVIVKTIAWEFLNF